jgi:hypothetical protein
MKKLEKITAAILADKKLCKDIEKSLSWVNGDDADAKRLEIFIEGANAWIDAIRHGRMLCIVKSVAASGMSRNFRYLYSTKNGFGNTYTFLSCMGETMAKGCIRVSGCGMDMNFRTNYTIIHRLHHLGFFDRKTCEVLAQKTPNCV